MYKELVELTGSSYMVLTTGSYDVMVEVVCQDFERHTELLYDRLQIIECIASTHTFFVLEAHKLAYGWGVGNPTTFKPQPNGEHTEHEYRFRLTVYPVEETAAAMATIDSLAPERRKLPFQIARKFLIKFIPLTGMATNSSARRYSWTAR